MTDEIERCRGEARGKVVDAAILGRKIVLWRLGNGNHTIEHYDKRQDYSSYVGICQLKIQPYHPMGKYKIVQRSDITHQDALYLIDNHVVTPCPRK